MGVMDDWANTRSTMASVERDPVVFFFFLTLSIGTPHRAILSLSGPSAGKHLLSKC